MSLQSLMAAATLMGVDAAPPDCLPLDAAIMRSFDVSGGIGTAEAERESAVADFETALALRRPQISAFTRSSLGDQGLADVQLENQVGMRVSQRLLDFGDARRARASARGAIARSGASLLAAQVEEAATVTQVYIDILEARAQTAEAQERARYFTERAQVTDMLIEDGLATRSEQIAVYAELARSRLDVSARELEIRAATRRLAARTGVESAVACPASALPSWLDDNFALHQLTADAVTEANPDLAAARAERRRLEADYERARRSRLPAVELVAIGSYAYDDLRDEWAFRDRYGIDLSIPLYGGASIRAQTDRARAARDAALRRVGSLRLQVAGEAEQIEARLLAAEVQRVHLERMVALQSERVEVLRGELALALTTLDELIEARLALEDVQLRLVEARFSVLRDRVRLRALAGDIPGVRTVEEPEFSQIWGWEPDPDD
ncbi:MAG: TolC family protein [Oceanicaulis sp.]